MGRDRAAYMREYRARKRALASHLLTIADVREVSRLRVQVDELEEEVRHLKAELAKRPALPDIRPFNSRPFTPVPKK